MDTKSLYKAIEGFSTGIDVALALAVIEGIFCKETREKLISKSCMENYVLNRDFDSKS